MLILCWRAAQLIATGDSLSQFLEMQRHCSLVPDLAIAPLSELELLPSLGRTRAECIIRGRQYIDGQLTASRLFLVDGVGETSSAEVSGWYQAHSGSGDTLKYANEFGQTNSRAN